MSNVAPKEAGSEYFWHAKRESDRVLLPDHNGHVLGGSVSYSDIDTIVRAHNERIRAAYKREVAAPATPLIPTEQRQQAIEESEADYALIQRLGGLLAEIAIVMKGPEPARTRWSYADLPKLVEVMAVELDMYHTVYGTTFPEGWGTPPAVTAQPALAAPVEQASAEQNQWMMDAAWAAYQNHPFDMCADHDAEQRQCVEAAVTAALASIPPQQAPYPIYFIRPKAGGTTWTECISEQSHDAAMRLGVYESRVVVEVGAAAGSVRDAALAEAIDAVQDVIAEADRNFESAEESGARRCLAALEKLTLEKAQ